MFRRILVANRGEIALRIIRAARELGVETAVVCSEADRGAAYLDLADEAICIGPSSPAASARPNSPASVPATSMRDATSRRFARPCAGVRIKSGTRTSASLRFSPWATSSRSRRDPLRDLQRRR